MEPTSRAESQTAVRQSLGRLQVLTFDNPRLRLWLAGRRLLIVGEGVLLPNEEGSRQAAVHCS
jgi:hypothetical protein